MGADKIGYTEGAGVNVGAIAKTESSETRKIERVAVDTDQLNFGSALWSAYSTLNGECAAIATEGKSHLVITTSYKTAATVATLRARWEDYQATPIPAYSEVFGIPNTGISDGGGTPRYYGEIQVIRTYGAKQMKLRLVSITSGDDISLWAVAI